MSASAMMITTKVMFWNLKTQRFENLKTGQQIKPVFK